MNVSRISSRLLLAVGLGLICSTAPWAASAEEATGEPILLLPLEPGADEQPLPPAQGPEAEERDAPAPSIEVGALPDFDPDSVGLLGPENGGFHRRLWEGTRRSLVEILLPRLPSDAHSVAMHRLARRLLLTAAPPPEGEGATSLLRLRAEALAALGDYTAAADLLRAAPGRLPDSPMVRLEVERLLLAGDLSGACTLVQASLPEFDDVFWQKGLIFCQILSQQYEAAALGLGLLREEGRADDRTFVTLMGALMGEREEGELVITQVSPLHLAMLRAAREPVSMGMVASMDPALLQAMALTAEAPVEARLTAAERAETLGVLPPETLGDLYAAVRFSPEELASPLTAAGEIGGPRARALLYQASRSQEVSLGRAMALQKAWQLARAEGGFMTAARVNLPAALEVEPTPELAWFAEDAARALFAAGEFERAGDWIELARNEASGDPAAEKGFVAVWPLAELADENPGLDLETLSLWWDSEFSLPDPERRERASLLFALLGALGSKVPLEYWEPLVPGPLLVTTAVPAPALWHALGEASANLRLGETVLLTLTILGNGGPAMASEPSLAAVVAGLRSVGLDAEARAIAIEAALAAGF